MTTVDWVRSFFEEQLTGMEVEHLRRRPETGGSMRQLIAYLVDQTVRRAALDAATYGGATTEVSWEDCLMVAALTELRSIRLLARNQT